MIKFMHSHWDIIHYSDLSIPILLSHDLPKVLFMGGLMIVSFPKDIGECVRSEPIDDIPILLSLLLRLRIPQYIDGVHTPHGNHQGLSVGWLTTLWLVYILTESDHRMNRVQDWVGNRTATLSELIGQPISQTDFTDDRLADVLEVFSEDAVWRYIEASLTRHSIRVYNLPVETVRLDATVGQVYHDPEKHPLFQVGRSKQGSFDVQFKMMLGALDPMGLPVAVDVVSGDRADDPLYVPIYRRIHQSLGKSGLLYVGDAKMSAMETRASIQSGNDFYLAPLSMVGQTPEVLCALLDRLEAGEVFTTDIYLPEDLPEDPMETPNPDQALAKGFETTVEREAQIKGRCVKWPERLLCVLSFRYARAQQVALEHRLQQAEAKLLSLTPPLERGKSQYREAPSLKVAIDSILDRYQVRGLLEVTLEREEQEHSIRAYGRRPARVETTVRYQVYVTRSEETIADKKRRLGWRLYATNAPKARLSLGKAVLSYREQYIVERDFARLHGRQLGITPLFVQRDDHALGLIRLLTIALRALVLLEFVVRQSLAEQQTELNGIYAGNPKRATTRPTSEHILETFDGITRTIITLPNGQQIQHVTPLSPVQERILELLHLPRAVYTNLMTIHMADVCPEMVA
jgi:transposase